MSKL
ncbi:hypothetical protein D043_3331A, partial [Vibrio parahaemolyticus EKP-021]|jgi:hypothetical protein